MGDIMRFLKVTTAVAVVAFLVGSACGDGADSRLGGEVGRMGEAGRACLEAKGFVVVIGADGSEEVKSPNQDIDPLPAVRACHEELRKAGLLPEPPPPPSEEALRARFSTLLEIQACMTAHGYPTRLPPGVETFIDRKGDWHPYDAVLLNVAGPLANKAAVGGDPGKLFADCPEPAPAPFTSVPAG